MSKKHNDSNEIGAVQKSSKERPQNNETKGLSRSLRTLLSSEARSRTPVTPSKGRVVGKMCSTKNSQSHQWESQLEYRVMLLMEFSTAVVSYHEQPSTFLIPLNDRTFKYTPDLSVTFANGSHAFVEVKPLEKVLNDKMKSRLTKAADYFSAQGSELMVLTEVEIEQRHVLYNIKFLKPYSSLKLDPEFLSEISTKMQESGGEVNLWIFMTWFDDKKYAFACLAQFLFAIDFYQVLTPSSIVRLPKEKDNENCLFQYRIAPLFE